MAGMLEEIRRIIFGYDVDKPNDKKTKEALEKVSGKKVPKENANGSDGLLGSAKKAIGIDNDKPHSDPTSWLPDPNLPTGSNMMIIGAGILLILMIFKGD